MNPGSITGGSFLSTGITGNLGVILGLGFGVIGVLDDAGIINTPIGGPKPVTYPLAVFAPHRAGGPFQVGFTAP